MSRGRVATAPGHDRASRSGSVGLASSRRAIQPRALRWAASLLVAAALTAEDDAVLIAAQRALAAGDAAQAQALADGDAHAARPGAARLLAARARLAAGDGDGAEAHVGEVAAWPTALRGSAWLVLGEAALAAGDDARALTALRAALAAGPMADDVERALALYAETAWRAGDRAGAGEAAEALWRRPACAYRAAAGLLLARACAERAPADARAYLAGARAAPDLTPARRLACAELLCRLLLPEHPGPCLVAAERDLAVLGADAAGELPLYRALALARLDPAEGAAALAALPPALAAQPVAVAERERLRAALADGARSDRGQQLERALAAIELGRDDDARALLEPLAADVPAALAALARTRGFAPARWLDCRAARDPATALAIARAAEIAGDAATAWAALGPALAVVGDGGDAPLLYWAERAARAAAPDRAAALRARLLAVADGSTETGLAWAEEAQRREATGASAEEAWARAERDLPRDHPWAPVAAARVARARLAAGDAAGAAAAVAAYAEAGAGDDADRCRFLLVQAWERDGKAAAALALARRLAAGADAAHRARLDALCARLATVVDAKP